MPKEILHARWLLICQLTLGQRMECMLAQPRITIICPTCPTLAQRCANMLALRLPNEQTYVGPMTWPTEMLRWLNVIMLSGNEFQPKLSLQRQLMGLSPNYNDLGMGRDMAWYAFPEDCLLIVLSKICIVIYFL